MQYEEKRFIIIGFLVILYSTMMIYSSYSSDSVLYYNGNAQSFTYYNIDKKDVFDTFKDLIPRDIKSKTLTIRADDIKPGTKLYLKLNSDINDDILNYINIYFYEGDNLLSIKDDMVEIYTFDKNTVVNLKVVVEVPTSLDNVIDDVALAMKWAFMVEEDGSLVDVPLTYDDFNLMLYISLIAISMVMIVIILFKAKSKEEA